MASSIVYNMDCMEYMKSLPDKAFSLAVVDPPYGGGCSQNVHVERETGYAEGAPILNTETVHASAVGLTATISASRTGGKWATRYQVQKGGIFSKDIRHWDIAPQQEYFNELARVSENQIIWGGNYFALPPTRCFLVWRKLTISENFTMAMAEYAWTSFNDNAKVFECAPQGTSKWQRIHPCEKPVALYAWIYSRYAKPGGQDSGYASRKRVEPYCRMGRGAGFRRGRAGQDLFRLGRKAIRGVFRATENGGFVSADRGGNRSGNSAG